MATYHYEYLVNNPKIKLAQGDIVIKNRTRYIATESYFCVGCQFSKNGCGTINCNGISFLKESATEMPQQRPLENAIERMKEMSLVHRTKDGREMFISQMTDEHLTNFIKFSIGEMKRCQAVGAASSSSFISQALYQVNDKQLIEQARSQFRLHYGDLAKYIMEAVIRGLDVTKDLQDVAGRTSRDNSMDKFMDFGDTKALPVNDFPDTFA